MWTGDNAVNVNQTIKYFKSVLSDQIEFILRLSVTISVSMYNLCYLFDCVNVNGLVRVRWHYFKTVSSNQPAWTEQWMQRLMYVCMYVIVCTHLTWYNNNEGVQKVFIFRMKSIIVQLYGYYQIECMNICVKQFNIKKSKFAKDLGTARVWLLYELIN